MSKEMREMINKVKNYGEIEISLKNININKENIENAMDKTSDYPSTYSHNKPLEIVKLHNGELYLMDGHHRVADELNKLDEPEDMLMLKLNAVINISSDDPKTYFGWIPFKKWVRENF